MKMASEAKVKELDDKLEAVVKAMDGIWSENLALKDSIATHTQP